MTMEEKLLRKTVLKEVSQELNLPSDQIELEQPLQSIGLSSMQALNVVRRLEERFDVNLDVSLILESKSLSVALDYLSGSVEGRSHADESEAKDEYTKLVVRAWGRMLGVDARKVRLQTPVGHLVGSRCFGLLAEGLWRETGVLLTVGQIYEAQTVEQQANLLRRKPESESASFIPLQRRTEVPTLYLIPGMGQTGLIWEDFAAQSNLNLVAIQPRGFQPFEFPYPTVESAASAYLKEILTYQPDGPYFLLGNCYGGWIAYEIARRLKLDGREVGGLFLLDNDPVVPRKKGAHSKPRGLARKFARKLRSKWRNYALQIRRRKQTEGRPGLRLSNKVWDAQLRAARRYIHRMDPYPGQVIFLSRSQEGICNSARFPFDWDSLLPEPPVIERIPVDDRINLLSKVALPQVARRIEILIGQASSRTSA